MIVLADRWSISNFGIDSSESNSVNGIMAEPTGFEPATFHVTGERSNQLNYGSACDLQTYLSEVFLTPNKENR
jgi:hypothetical protein